jgi:hypothetical protein
MKLKLMTFFMKLHLAPVWFLRSHEIYETLGSKPLASILEQSLGISPCNYLVCVGWETTHTQGIVW